MAKPHSEITPELAAFITAQPMFFVATAPDEGRINVSPKGLDGTFRILGPHKVAFLNITGSGNETAAHLRQNGRITLMFCSFTARPLILRLYGTGRAVHQRDAEWAELEPMFADLPAKRQFVVVDVTSIIASCGEGVPMMDLVGQRSGLPDWARSKGEDGMRDYQRQNNVRSFDGLPTGLFEDEERG
jgi:predicted pyridoxine 5'-phosphate oxidase superfamily flavin-nucleotide-binding protein